MTPSLTIPTLSARGILYRLAGAAVLAAVLHVLVVLPAEFHRDPTGFGAWSGLLTLSAPGPAPATPAPPSAVTVTYAIPAAYSSPVPFRTDTIRIPLDGDATLEYKVRMKAGARLLYSWTVDQGETYWDFHGEPPQQPDKSQSYETGTSRTAHGGLTAPMDGIHGWQFLNQEGHRILITVKLAGFYELIPK